MFVSVRERESIGGVDCRGVCLRKRECERDSKRPVVNVIQIIFVRK